MYACEIYDIIKNRFEHSFNDDGVLSIKLNDDVFMYMYPNSHNNSYLKFVSGEITSYLRISDFTKNVIIDSDMSRFKNLSSFWFKEPENYTNQKCIFEEFHILNDLLSLDFKIEYDRAAHSSELKIIAGHHWLTKQRTVTFLYKNELIRPMCQFTSENFKNEIELDVFAVSLLRRNIKGSF